MASINQNYYQILGIPENATISEIKEAYRVKIRALHPDINPAPHAENLFLLLQEAYETLIDPEKRSEYNSSVGILDQMDVFKEFSDSSREIRLEKDRDPELYDEVIFATWEPKQIKEHESIKEKFIGSFVKHNPIKEVRKKIQNKRVSKKDLLGERIYHYTVTTLESILGTERTMVIQSIDGNKKKILLKIPKGIKDGTYLKVPLKTISGDPPQALINVEPHSYLKSDLNDLYLSVPFHKNEISETNQVIVYTIKGRVKVDILILNNKSIRIKNHGLYNSIENISGDFYIKPLILENENIKEIKKDREDILSLLAPLHL